MRSQPAFLGIIREVRAGFWKYSGVLHSQRWTLGCGRAKQPQVTLHLHLLRFSSLQGFPCVAFCRGERRERRLWSRKRLPGHLFPRALIVPATKHTEALLWRVLSLPGLRAHSVRSRNWPYLKCVHCRRTRGTKRRSAGETWGFPGSLDWHCCPKNVTQALPPSIFFTQSGSQSNFPETQTRGRQVGPLGSSSLMRPTTQDNQSWAC